MKAPGIDLPARGRNAAARPFSHTRGKGGRESDRMRGLRHLPDRAVTPHPLEHTFERPLPSTGEVTTLALHHNQNAVADTGHGGMDAGVSFGLLCEGAKG